MVNEVFPIRQIGIVMCFPYISMRLFKKKAIDLKLVQLRSLKGLVETQIMNNLNEIQTFVDNYLGSNGETNLHNMRARKLEVVEDKLDRILQIKGLLTARGIHFNEYFGIR